MTSLFKYLKLGIVGGLSLITLVVIARSAFDPKWGKVNAIALPPTIQIPGWRQVNVQPTQVKEPETDRQVLGNLYTFTTPANTQVSLEIFFYENPAGKMDEFFKIYNHTKTGKYTLPTMTVIKDTQGFHGSYLTDGKANLAACINPRGVSTITNEQFQANRNDYDLTPQRILPVVFGFGRLREWKCLWVKFSIPKQDTKELAGAWEYLSNNRRSYFPDFVDANF